MTDYRRNFSARGRFFFTINLAEWHPRLRDDGFRKALNPSYELSPNRMD